MSIFSSRNRKKKGKEEGSKSVKILPFILSLTVALAFSLYLFFFTGQQKAVPLVFASLVLLFYFSYLLLRKEVGEKAAKYFRIIVTLVLFEGVFFLIFEEVLKRLLPSQVLDDFVIFSFPVAFGALILGFLLEIFPAVLFVLLNSIIYALLAGFNAEMIFYSMVVGTVALFGVLHYSRYRRSTIYRTAFLLVYPVSLLFAALVRISGELKIKILLLDLGAVSANVVLLAIFSSFLIPLLEYFFKILTPLRLVELSNTNQEIFRRMAMEAPGTYLHSLMVATLAERAAEAIGANPLLAKVGALYHDIGKLEMPAYFSENQINKENLHEKLSPSVSSLVIARHVKEGLKMAEELGLPDEIKDFIPQHHGTSLIKFFYAKAKEEGENVDESAFRYPGPKPRSKEAAIVMFADSVEAAAKSLKDISEEKIREVVEDVMRYMIEDGQLDEAPLTIAELKKIADVFVETLAAIYHKRVEYPDLEDLRRKNGSKQAEKGEGGQAAPGKVN